MIHELGGKAPRTAEAAFIAWNAEVAGEVSLGPDSSVWFGAVVRGDLAAVKVGNRTNVQDNATVHVDKGAPCAIGSGVTVGHNAVLHGCSVGDDCIIGMGAVVLTGASIGKESIVGAHALVTEGKAFPPRSLIIGSPAKAARAVSDEELANIRANARTYIGLAAEAANGGQIS
jgi:carbonic anhydrase/acetyltransferase-like protein (isoleucine patch superfamily)